MAAYLLITLTVHDKARFQEYAAAARTIAPSYGAQYLVIGRPEATLEGELGAERTILTVWPSVDRIHAFWNSPEYRAAAKLREGAATVNAIVLDGLPAQPA